MSAKPIEPTNSEPCPVCKKPNRVTLADRERGWACDECADSERERRADMRDPERVRS